MATVACLTEDTFHAMMYVLIAGCLFILQITYVFLAQRYGIMDGIKSRSSHSIANIRGGGILFPLAMLLYVFVFGVASAPFLLGMLLVSFISFWDDIRSLPVNVRLVIHLLAVTALLFSVSAFEHLPAWLLPVTCVAVIGVLNAYNFMDGINGITGLYSLCTLASLLYLNEYKVHFTHSDCIIFAIIAVLVFLVFNGRRKALCFAGDVGAISIGFWIAYFLLLAMIKAGSILYLLFLAVYGADTVLTIILRLKHRHNIFKPHRLHLYQLLANECRIPHLKVAAVYAAIQLLINLVVIMAPLRSLYTYLIVCFLLVMAYFVTRRVIALKSV